MGPCSGPRRCVDGWGISFGHLPFPDKKRPFEKRRRKIVDNGLRISVVSINRSFYRTAAFLGNRLNIEIYTDGRDMCPRERDVINWESGAGADEFP